MMKYWPNPTYSSPFKNLLQFSIHDSIPVSSIIWLMYDCLSLPLPDFPSGFPSIIVGIHVLFRMRCPIHFFLNSTIVVHTDNFSFILWNNKHMVIMIQICKANGPKYAPICTNDCFNMHNKFYKKKKIENNNNKKWSLFIINKNNNLPIIQKEILSF